MNRGLGGERERERQTDRQTDRQTERDTERDRRDILVAADLQLHLSTITDEEVQLV